MSIKVNLTAEVPLELFSAIRNGGLDGLKPQELATISSIATQALLEGSKAARHISTPPAALANTTEDLIERLQPKSIYQQPDRSESHWQNIHEADQSVSTSMQKEQEYVEQELACPEAWQAMHRSRTKWNYMTPYQRYEKVRELRASCEYGLAHRILTADLALHYMQGECRLNHARKDEYLPRGYSFRDSMIHYFISKRSEYETAETVTKGALLYETVYVILTQRTGDHLPRRLALVFPTSQAASLAAKNEMLLHTLIRQQQYVRTPTIRTVWLGCAEMTKARTVSLRSIPRPSLGWRRIPDLL